MEPSILSAKFDNVHWLIDRFQTCRVSLQSRVLLVITVQTGTQPSSVQREKTAF